MSPVSAPQEAKCHGSGRRWRKRCLGSDEEELHKPFHIRRILELFDLAAAEYLLAALAQN